MPSSSWANEFIDLGSGSLAAGVATYSGVSLPLIPLTLIAIGATIILELLSARNTRRTSART